MPKFKLPPIRIERHYMRTDKTGDFILRAAPIPAPIWNAMTDAEKMARQDEEKKAIEAEWARLKAPAGEHWAPCLMVGYFDVRPEADAAQTRVAEFLKATGMPGTAQVDTAPKNSAGKPLCVFVEFESNEQADKVRSALVTAELLLLGDPKKAN